MIYQTLLTYLHNAGDPGTNTVLIMTSSIRSAELLREFLGSINPDGDPGTQGRTMMERKLRRYFAKQAWKKSMKSGSGFGKSSASGARNGGDSGLSEALRRKDKEREARIASRRRVRGGGPSASSSRGTVPPEAPTTGTINLDEEIAFAYDVFRRLPSLILTSISVCFQISWRECLIPWRFFRSRTISTPSMAWSSPNRLSLCGHIPTTVTM